MRFHAAKFIVSFLAVNLLVAIYCMPLRAETGPIAFATAPQTDQAATALREADAY
jgi:hypothetical protein